MAPDRSRLGKARPSLILPLLITSSILLAACDDDHSGPGALDSAGGTISLLDGAVTLTVPSGALSTPVTFSAVPVDGAPLASLVVEGSVYEIGPAGTTFAEPALLQLTYDPHFLPSGLKEVELALHRSEGEGWGETAHHGVNLVTHTVSGSVSSLGLFSARGLSVSSVEVSPQSASLYPGESVSLNARARASNGIVLGNRPIGWSSSNEGVAIADGSGLVTAVEPGEAALTASAEGQFGVVEITVKEIPMAYVVNLSRSQVAVVDLYRNEVTDSIPVGDAPWGIAVSPDERKLYVTARGDEAVSVVDLEAGEMTGSIPVGEMPWGVVVSMDGSRAYVANLYSRSVSVIDLASETVVATISVPGLPSAITLSPEGARAYVGMRDPGMMAVLDLATNTVLTTIEFGSWHQGIAITPDGARAYVTDHIDEKLFVVDLVTNTMSDTLQAGERPWSVALTPDGSTAYVSDLLGNRVFVIDVATNTLVTSIPVGTEPGYIAINQEGTRAYVANWYEGGVSVLDVTSNTFLAGIPLDGWLGWIALTPPGG